MVDARAPDAYRAGIGLRAAHGGEIARRTPPLGFLEVHSENYFAPGGAALATLERLRAVYPVSLHGVGLSLGSADPLDETHLRKLSELVRRIQPALVSEHLCWSSAGGRHANDLLPMPYTPESLALFASRVEAVQERLGRAILVENISSYLEWKTSTLPEWEFLAEVARRTGCGILLDLNNLWVNSRNHGFPPGDYLAAIPPGLVDEYHLAGFEKAAGLLIDTHARAVSSDVWALYRDAVQRFGARPTLVEWDEDLPDLDVLLGEARRADAILGELGPVREPETAP